MPQIKWLPEALNDIARLDGFLRPKSSEAASRAIYTLIEQIQCLEKMPGIGRPMDDSTGRRELVIPISAGAYIVRYIEENASTLVIIRIWHNREKR